MQSLSLKKKKKKKTPNVLHDYLSIRHSSRPAFHRNSHSKVKGACTLNSRERAYPLAWQGTGEGEEKKKRKKKEKERKEKKVDGNFRKWRWKLASVGGGRHPRNCRGCTRSYACTNNSVPRVFPAHRAREPRTRTQVSRVQARANLIPLSPIALEWPAPCACPTPA